MDITKLNPTSILHHIIHLHPFTPSKPFLVLDSGYQIQNARPRVLEGGGGEEQGGVRA